MRALSQARAFVKLACSIFGDALWRRLVQVEALLVPAVQQPLLIPRKKTQTRLASRPFCRANNFTVVFLIRHRPEFLLRTVPRKRGPEQAANSTSTSYISDVSILFALVSVQCKFLQVNQSEL